MSQSQSERKAVRMMRVNLSRQLLYFPLAAASTVLGAQSAAAQDVCAETPPYRAVVIDGEAYGARGFEREMGDGLTFALERVDAGWRIFVSHEADPQTNLALATPPLRMPETNPISILGWHFRNAANTGPNEGDVNAPQTRRRFVFGDQARNPEFNPELIVPSAPGEAAPDGAPPVTPFGVGELEIIEMGLTDLAPGQRARMNYLLFQVCMQWMAPEGAAESGDIGAGDPENAEASPPVPPIPQRVRNAFMRCGLSEDYELVDDVSRVRPEWNVPPFLEGDFDGDGRMDFAATVRRQTDNKRGLAVCRADESTLDLVGFDGRYGEHLSPEYFDRFDYWTVHEGAIGQGVAEGAPPSIPGDAILLAIEESSSVLVFWDGAQWSSYWQGD